jgi:hypothetical protein
VPHRTRCDRPPGPSTLTCAVRRAHDADRQDQHDR